MVNIMDLVLFYILFATLFTIHFLLSQGNTRDYSMKIFELQKQLALDVEEAQRMQVTVFCTAFLSLLFG
jgi:hypothetical protein